MDSLELPIDLIWEGKIEPLSPNQLALVNSEDIMIFENDFTTGKTSWIEIYYGTQFDVITFFPDFILNHADIIFDGKQSPEELILELQQDISEEDDDDECEYLIDFYEKYNQIISWYVLYSWNSLNFKSDPKI